MTLFNDLWKKFSDSPSLKASPSTPRSSPETPSTTTAEQTVQPTTTSSSQRSIHQVLDNFQTVEIESLEQKTLAEKLKTLKAVVDQPKEEKLELRFTQIKQTLGPSETHETVRQERWPEDIHCPKCQSQRLKRLPPLGSQSPHNHRYECLACGNIFNDDTGTPMEHGVPSLNVWMHCWYLMGCTDSVNFIASKLGLDTKVVEMMVEQLQKSFQAQKPLTRFIGFEQWNQQSQHLRAQLQEDLLREYESLNANIATVPKDTAEFRRQQNIRRELAPTITPPSPTAGGGRKR